MLQVEFTKIWRYFHLSIEEVPVLVHSKHADSLGFSLPFIILIWTSWVDAQSLHLHDNQFWNWINSLCNLLRPLWLSALLLVVHMSTIQAFWNAWSFHNSHLDKSLKLWSMCWVYWHFSNGFTFSVQFCVFIYPLRMSWSTSSIGGVIKALDNPIGNFVRLRGGVSNNCWKWANFPKQASIRLSCRWCCSGHVIPRPPKKSQGTTFHFLRLVLSLFNFCFFRELNSKLLHCLFDVCISCHAAGSG